MYKLLTLMALIMILPLKVNSAELQSLSALKQFIEKTVTAQLIVQNKGKITVSADAIDERLKLNHCPDNQLSLSNPYHTPLITTTTIAIECLTPGSHWTLYVPVKISVYQPIMTASHQLNKGNIIHSEDLAVTDVDIRQLKQGYFSQPDEIIGRQCKQEITSGAPIDPIKIAMPKLVFKGEMVTIQAINETINVTMEGIALNEGALGDSIQVKNLSSKRIIEAQISDRKKVKVAI